MFSFIKTKENEEQAKLKSGFQPLCARLVRRGRRVGYGRRG